jgi:5-methylcytosine-specific restriction endonuclease McrA
MFMVYYAKHGKKCAVDFVTENVDLHHMTYKRLGNEWDEDLVPLCRDCHKSIHRLFPGKGRKMKNKR